MTEVLKREACRVASTRQAARERGFHCVDEVSVNAVPESVCLPRFSACVSRSTGRNMAKGADCGFTATR